MQTNERFSEIAQFCAAGLALVPIPSINGKPTKAPRENGWNKPRDTQNTSGYSSNPDHFKNCNGTNIGLYHQASRTLAFDIDDIETTRLIFEETAGIRLLDWLQDLDRAEIKSPKANRGKLLFRLPDELESVGLRQYKLAGHVVFELRCGNCQDVIYGRHPEGGNYQFIGNPAAIPPIPEVLLDMLKHFDDWKPCFDSALGIDTELPKISPRKPQKYAPLPGWQDPIHEFNQSRGVSAVLLANGYKPAGRDRFIRPNSASRAPGISLLRNCQDGIERVFSHGGDALNDSYAHDAFDCFRLLECEGDFSRALNWSPEITKHNQRLFKQEKAKIAPKPVTDNTETPDSSEQKELPDGTILDDSHIEILKKINESYAHIVLGGKNLIAGQKHCQVQGIMPTFEAPHEFKKKFMHEPLVGMGKKKNRGQAWLEWSGKRYMPNGTGFYPDSKKCPPGVFNLFTGYKVKPAEGDCSPYLDHLQNVICAGDKISFTYLIQWMAHLFQKPDVKPNVAIVLKSVEGTGKGAMAEPLLEILGIHGNKTNGAYAIAGRFNGVVASRLLIVADEVDLTDKYVADRLKSIITEPTVNLERKGLEIEALPNYCRLIFASNHARVLNAGIRERRYLVLEPSDAKAQDQIYFNTLWAWIRNGGAAKLLHYLLHVDISDFNPYKCPQTEALIAEKLDNLSGVNRFFYTEITKPEPFGGKFRIKAHDLIDDYIAWSNADGLKITESAARTSVGRMMSRLNIVVKGRSDRSEGKFYEIPERDQLVQLFSVLLDIPENSLEL